MGIIKESATLQKNILALNANITTNTTTVGAVIDTKDFENGLYFNFFLTEHSDGDFTLKIEHSDTSGSGYANVAATNLVFNRDTGVLPTLSSASTNGDNIIREGVVGTKRYVRPSVVSVSASGTNRNVIVAIQDSEYTPIYADGSTTP